MDIIENIVNYFKTNSDNNIETSPIGTCSLCWGYQEYNGKIRELLADKQIDVNNHKDVYVFIEDFVKINIEGITLKEGIVSKCPTCSSKKLNI